MNKSNQKQLKKEKQESNETIFQNFISKDKTKKFFPSKVDSFNGIHITNMVNHIL